MVMAVAEPQLVHAIDVPRSMLAPAPTAGAGSIRISRSFLALMAVLGPRPRHLAVRFGLITAMLAVALYSGAVVLRNADGIRLEVGGLPSRLPEGDARRVRFDELHTLSTRLMMVNLFGALTLLFWEARE